MQSTKLQGNTESFRKMTLFKIFLKFSNENLVKQSNESIHSTELTLTLSFHYSKHPLFSKPFSVWITRRFDLIWRLVRSGSLAITKATECASKILWTEKTPFSDIICHAFYNNIPISGEIKKMHWFYWIIDGNRYILRAQRKMCTYSN